MPLCEILFARPLRMAPMSELFCTVMIRVLFPASFCLPPLLEHPSPSPLSPLPPHPSQTGSRPVVSVAVWDCLFCMSFISSSRGILCSHECSCCCFLCHNFHSPSSPFCVAPGIRVRLGCRRISVHFPPIPLDTPHSFSMNSADCSGTPPDPRVCSLWGSSQSLPPPPSCWESSALPVLLSVGLT